MVQNTLLGRPHKEANLVFNGILQVSPTISWICGQFSVSGFCHQWWLLTDFSRNTSCSEARQRLKHELGELTHCGWKISTYALREYIKIRAFFLKFNHSIDFNFQNAAQLCFSLEHVSFLTKTCTESDTQESFPRASVIQILSICISQDKTLKCVQC